MNTISARSAGDVSTPIHDQSSAMRIAHGSQAKGPRQKGPSVEILLSKLHGFDAPGEGLLNRPCLGAGQNFAGQGWRKTPPIGHQHHAGSSTRADQSSIPSIGLDAVA